MTPSLRSPRGTGLSCKGWQQEAALRLLLNSLDPELAGDAEEIPAGFRQAGGESDARFLQILLDAIRALANDETLLVDAEERISVRRAGVLPPRVVADQTFAPAWISLGAQDSLSAAYEVFAYLAHDRFGGDLSGKLVASCGMGALRGVPSLAATMNGAAFLGIDPDPEAIKRCMKSGYCDVLVNDLDEALRILKNAVRKREPASVGLVGGGANVLAVLARRGVVPDLLANPAAALPSDPVRALQAMGTSVFDHDEILRLRLRHGRRCVRWVALSGEPADLHRIDRLALDVFAPGDPLSRWITLARRHIRTQGLPARSCWMDASEFGRLCQTLQERAGREEWKAPAALVCDACGGRKELAGFVRESADAVSEWEIDLALQAACGASWIALRRGLDQAAGNYSAVAAAAVWDTLADPEQIKRIFESIFRNSAAPTPHGPG